MQKKTTTYLAFLVALLCMSSISFSQSSLNVAGHTATIQGMTFDYSIGEMAIISTEHQTNLIVTQGLLQPYDAGQDASTHPNSNALNILDYIKVFPNPTQSIVNIESNESEEGTYHFQIIDAMGKVVYQHEQAFIPGVVKHQIDLSSYAQGNYYLLLRKNTEESFSYKIQKIN
ncbi:MAG: T9SS type A sorting domain-containing protein [Chitinophagaceae bacterium]